MQQFNILVTGGAGFIGSHLCEKLLFDGHLITVVDNFDPFYSKEIKQQNLNHFIENKNCRFIELDIRNNNDLTQHCTDKYDIIIHLAAKAGVRPSILNPSEYQEVNVNGTQNLLEFARIRGIKKFIFASSSSVYGINPNVPWNEDDHILNPISPYASTKISGELLGHVYSHLYSIQFIALRFFTVFGPRQRPDLAIHLFSKKILQNEPITMFGDGSTLRDYTYVDDIVDGIVGAIKYQDSNYEIFNLGNHECVSLLNMIQGIEYALGKKAIINNLPQQPGDVPKTFADIQKAQSLLGYHPHTNFKVGVEKFVQWLKSNSN